ncbi:MAG: hypothetical protein ACJ768_19475 [Gaiellaceae bacterium]
MKSPLRMARRAALIAAVAMACGGATNAQAAQLFGFNDNSFAGLQNVANPADTAAQLEHGMGAQVQRLSVQWWRIEPSDSTGCNRTTGSWTLYDNTMQALAAHGVKPVLVIMDAPKWAWGNVGCGAGGSTCPYAESKCHVPPGDHFLGAWQSIVTQIADRYHGQLAGIEVWNEPNNVGWWQAVGGPDPAEYEKAFAYAAAGVHSVNATYGTHIPVLTAGLVYEDATTNSTYTIPDFLSGFYAAGGASAMQPGDAVGAHVYPTPADITSGCLVPSPAQSCNTSGFNLTLGQYKSTVGQYDSGRPLWITETGITTTPATSPTEQQQASGLDGIIKEVSPMTAVGALLIHTAIEPNANASKPAEQGYGVYHQTLQPKPAACTIALDEGQPKPAGCP